MKHKINFREANNVQLAVIAYSDTMATLEDKKAATEEIMRRAKKRFERRQYKMKAVYPR